MTTFLNRFAPSATQLIRNDHGRVLDLFHKLKADTADATREAICRNICTSLEIHAMVEEQVFYPALREAGLDNDVLSKSVPEHDEMRLGIAALRAGPPEAATQMRLLGELMRGVLHHVADEETVLLPLAEQCMSTDLLGELGNRMAQLKLELAAPRADGLASDTARAAPARTVLIAAGALTAGMLLLKGMRRERHFPA